MSNEVYPKDYAEAIELVLMQTRKLRNIECIVQQITDTLHSTNLDNDSSWLKHKIRSINSDISAIKSILYSTDKTMTED